jgi:class 3 adenylate cyclase
MMITHRIHPRHLRRVDPGDTGAAMRQIADWLKELGLGQYSQRFAENDISFTILSDLSDQDLKELGVSSLGHRRQLLRTIAEQNSAENSPPKPTAAAAASVVPQLRDTAERRQVTVMFSDLVGSTALSARMDPEDLREVISAYQQCVAETVRRFGGFVAKYMGDGVLVYFGYPQAHEDDTERAVRAGLELVGAVSALKRSPPLQTRIGIATGLVVVGDLIGSGEAQERGIVGETPNLAARLQRIAEPNMVVIAEGTRRLLGHLFELRDLGAKDLKGIAGPVRAWAALRASSVESRFEALHTSDLTALVGREEEVELLLRRWSLAKSGEGRSCCSPARPVSGNRGSRPRFWNGSPTNHTRACAIFARRCTPTARFIRSLARWNVRRGLRTTTPRRQSWINSMPCSREVLCHARTRHYLPKCCRCRTMDAIPPSDWTRSNAGSELLKPSRRKSRR